MNIHSKTIDFLICDFFNYYKKESDELMKKEPMITSIKHKTILLKKLTAALFDFLGSRHHAVQK